MNARKQEVLKVAEQAAAWLVAVEEDDHAQFAALNNWLRESPLHVEMFLRMTAVERLMDAVPADERQKLRENLEADDNVRHISPMLPSLDQRRAVRFSLRRLAMAASVIVTLAVLGWLAVAYVDVDPSERFTTGVGEQRSISLPDGSVLYLNADSQVKVLYSEQERLLQMISGEALFKVQRDPSRPFRVVMDDVTVQALGTQFNIHRRTAQTTVAVIEGAVRVSTRAPDRTSESPAPLPSLESNAASGEQVLTAGQAAHIAGKAGIRRAEEPVNTEDVTAWRQRRLIFRWAPLGEIAEEFNRYNRSPQIRIETEALRNRRYTAVFDADAPQELLKFLEQDGTMRVSPENSEWVVRER